MFSFSSICFLCSLFSFPVRCSTLGFKYFLLCSVNILSFCSSLSHPQQLLLDVNFLFFSAFDLPEDGVIRKSPERGIGSAKSEILTWHLEKDRFGSFILVFNCVCICVCC